MEDIFDIAKKIEKAGGRLYLVGGAVRDKLLERKNEDEDYCVVGIELNKFKELFPKAKARGKAFEVFELLGKEFALARRETKIGTGHKEFQIETGKDITIEEDLSRRDITINAIAQDVITKEIIDPFNGRNDINKKIIRATTSAFKEDPLRVYRVARFAAQLQFDVEDKTFNMMNELKDELDSLSAERVFVEFSKALDTNKPSIFFNILRKANVLEVHFKEIYDLIGALQPEKFHPEGDAYNHTMMALDKSAELTDKLEVRFATLVHDLGKGITPKEEYPHHYQHEIKGIPLVEQLGNRIKVPTNWIKCGQVACKDHMRGGIFYKMKPAKKVDFIERVNKSNLGLSGLQVVVYSDKLSSRNIDEGSIDFETIGKECFNQITGKLIKEKYNLKEGIELGNKLREERIEWIKKWNK